MPRSWWWLRALGIPGLFLRPNQSSDLAPVAVKLNFQVLRSRSPGDFPRLHHAPISLVIAQVWICTRWSKYDENIAKHFAVGDPCVRIQLLLPQIASMV